MATSMSRTTSRNAARPRPRARWLHAAVAFLLALTAVVTGLAPVSDGIHVDEVQAEARNSFRCCWTVPASQHEFVSIPEGDRAKSLFYKPDHNGGRITIMAEVRLASSWSVNVFFPTLFGVQGGPGTAIPGRPGFWQRTYDISRGVQDSGMKEFKAVATASSDNRDQFQLNLVRQLEVVADGTAPTVTITLPKQSPQIVEVDGTGSIKATTNDATSGSGLDVVEFYEGDPDADGSEPFQTVEKPKAKASFEVGAGTHEFTVRAWDNVGNSGEATVTFCGGSCDDSTAPAEADNWRTAPTVSSLPFSQRIPTSALTSAADDPLCFVSQAPVPYTHSAWFRLRLSADAEVYVDTEGSTSTANPDGELDTVLLVGWIPPGSTTVTPFLCSNDVVDPEDGTFLSADAEFHAHADIDYYVMAGTVASPPQDGSIKVEMRVYDPSGD